MWITFLIFIIEFFLRDFIAFLLISKVSKETYVSTYYKFVPIICLIELIILFLYIKIKNICISTLGLKKVGLRKALISGSVTGIILRVLPLIRVEDFFHKAIMNIQLIFLNPIAYAFSLHVLFCSPFSEELFFRGLLYSVLREKIPKVLAIIIIAFISTILHPVRNTFIFFFQFFVNIIFTVLYEKTDNLYSSITAHFLFNLFSILIYPKTGF